MRRLMDYLPENYPASRETAAFQEALQPEADALWAARDGLLAQLDPYTATWGLDYWERALGIWGWSCGAGRSRQSFRGGPPPPLRW